MNPGSETKGYSSPFLKKQGISRDLPLILRQPHHKPIQFPGHFNLARQSGIAPWLHRDIDQGLFNIVGLSGYFQPGFIDMDMTGRAGTAAATIGGNTWHHIAGCRLHNGNTLLGVNRMACTIVCDEGNLWHRVLLHIKSNSNQKGLDIRSGVAGLFGLIAVRRGAIFSRLSHNKQAFRCLCASG